MGKRDEMVHLRFSTRARVPLGRLGYNGTFPRITQAVRLKLRRPLLILRLKLGRAGQKPSKAMSAGCTTCSRFQGSKTRSVYS